MTRKKELNLHKASKNKTKLEYPIYDKHIPGCVCVCTALFETNNDS
jgi:hypothetical protein